jgi:hypothetical protein
MRARAGDDHPHDVIVVFVALPGPAVVGEKSAKQIREHHKLLRIGVAFVSVQYHLQLLGLHPIIRFASVRGFRVPGNAVGDLVKSLAVCIKDCIRIRRCERPGCQSSTTHRNTKHGNASGANPPRRRNGPILV